MKTFISLGMLSLLLTGCNGIIKYEDPLQVQGYVPVTIRYAGEAIHRSPWYFLDGKSCKDARLVDLKSNETARVLVPIDKPASFNLAAATPITGRGFWDCNVALTFTPSANATYELTYVYSDNRCGFRLIEEQEGKKVDISGSAKKRKYEFQRDPSSPSCVD
jgi:hypothetical protein